MGLFSFIKSAGEKIFGSDKEEAIAAPSSNADLQAHVKQYGLDVENLNVRCEGDKVICEGEASSQSEREKVILALGNVKGVASVQENIKVRGAEAQFHTVVSGDYLSKISKTYYGDASKYNVIFEANKPMLKDPDLIYPGQVLRIPALS